MIISGREIFVRALIHGRRRRDVEHGHPLHGFGIIESEPVRYAAAPVMTSN